MKRRGLGMSPEEIATEYKAGVRRQALDEAIAIADQVLDSTQWYKPEARGPARLATEALRSRLLALRDG